MDQEIVRKIISLRHTLHQHPELSGHERETIERIRQFLLSHTSLDGFDRDGWLYAVKTGADPEAGSREARTAFSASEAFAAEFRQAAAN